MYALVVVDNPSPMLDKPFHYSIPEKLRDEIKTGCRVVVPFGLSNKPIEGCVVGLSEECPGHVDRIKPVLRRVGDGPALSEELVMLAEWMRDEYLCTWQEALGCVMPAVTRQSIGTKKPGKYRLWVRPLAAAKGAIPGNAVRMRAVMDFFAETALSEICCGTLMDETGCSMQTLRALEKKGLVEVFDKRVIRSPEMPTGLVRDNVERLTSSQREVLDTIRTMHRQGRREILLHGVTGSGKTEIYLRLIGDALEEGKQAIVLVPEISLTPQMVEWYYKRFGSRAAVIHSRLSAGERYDQWEGIKRGDYDVTIGARSAVFAPFDNLGLIIIDEEHEHTYKSESSPRYVTHTVARKRCEFCDALLVLGSATPSIETYYRAGQGGTGLVRLTERVSGRTLPAVEIADMREELKEGNRSVFSKKLREGIEAVLLRGEQAVLFLNRRGYSAFVSCRNCGSVIKCKKCDISLTYHRGENFLVCHYCGYRRRLPKRCEVCGSDRIRHLGSGTEKLERVVNESFGDARVLRMDMDTTRGKGAHYSILKAFKDREADILLGTQMIAKGLDFPGVTLVGVVLADFSLNLPDFRAAERTFQLLTQVSGRAGRGDRPGKVVIQTYNPGHYSIQAAKTHDFEGFYGQEIEVRKEFGYPPFERLINIIVSGEGRREVIEGARAMYNGLCDRLQDLKKKYEIYGPSQAMHSKIKNKYRWQVIVKAPDLDEIKEAVREAKMELLKSQLKGISIITDVDPVNLG